MKRARQDGGRAAAGCLHHSRLGTAFAATIHHFHTTDIHWWRATVAFAAAARMAPSKRQKSKAALDQTAEQVPCETTPRSPDKSPEQKPVDETGPTKRTTAPRPRSWYSLKGSSFKTPPIAQIAKESISVAKGATSESSEASRRPSQSLSKSARGSSRKSDPLIAEATKVHAVSDFGDKSRPRFPSEEKLRLSDGTAEKRETASQAETVVEHAPLPPDPEVDDSRSLQSTDSKPPASTSTWFGWWSRPDGYGDDTDSKGNKRRKLDTEEASGTPLPGSPQAQPVKSDEADVPMADANAEISQAKTAAQWEGVQPEVASTTGSTRSWFGLWSNAQNQQAVAEAEASKKRGEPQATVIEAATQTSTENAVPPESTSATASANKKDDRKDKPDRPRSSGWAFWSHEQPKEDTAKAGSPQKEVGEIAVADTPSQSHPEAAQFNEQQDDTQTANTSVKRTNTLLRPKRGRVDKVKDATESTNSTPAASRSQTPSTFEAPTAVNTPANEESDTIKLGKAAQVRPNLILPTFKDVYPPAPNPGMLERLSGYLASALRLPGTADTFQPPQHIYQSHTKPKIRKAIAIGVHGFFPAPLIQKFLGQPTGTSIRFANYAAASIKSWCQAQQPEIKDVEIEKVALEGEGIIGDRVTTLWKLLLNWLSQLRQADFILVAAHSQGVPVAFMLLAKLIQLGALSPNVKIGVCAMAGINLGPFLEYRSRLFGGSALELFEFCDVGSKVSKSYFEALDICLRHNVRVTFIGSWDDQLVSLESSLYAPLSHPYVCRAVFIDGRLHTPNFLTHLVVFALKLRNLGISDHGLLRELSAPLAGSLVGGEGHSRVYDDPAVYVLAVDFALSSTDVAPLTTPAAVPTAASSLLASDKDRARAAAAARRASLSGYPASTAQANHIRRGSPTASSQLPGITPILAHYEPVPPGQGANPFTLPWAVRGMLEEEGVKRDAGLMAEVRELVAEFEGWRPTSKVLKDVRWRLEGVRSLP